MNGPVYLRDCWYVAAWSKEIGRHLIERWVLEEPLALYRTEAGQAVALGNRCVHRRYPLSRGKLIGDTVECGYHGFTYDRTGTCIRIPSQDHIPSKARVKCYPIAERWGWAWVWMGEPELADEASIPDHHWLADPHWAAVGGTLHLKARYELLNENLLDLSHLTFLHPGTIGTDDVARSRVETEVQGRLVRVSRVMKDTPAAPLHAKTMGLSGRVDRWQIEEFTIPNFHLIHVGAVAAGGSREQACEYKVLNAVTPETRTTTTYYWAVSRNYALEESWITDYMQDGIDKIFLQDVEGCEAQEVMIATDRPDGVELNASADAGVVYARRTLTELLEREARLCAAPSGAELTRTP
ncbi:MAG: aromatic ring-hydroxylating dioxygenase subunit alpha [Candidatus Rokubacteria bacterium]|nr:aromatic ring-hydroxylating dioxygenase subunit alpha [Candidatus Rokubacteria bacterium]